MANYSNNLGQIRLGWRTAPVFTPDDPGTPNTIDPDSTNFILASGISDSLQISAIETLVADLKAYGLWTKMKAIYPFVGGSASSHKFNLKDPRNLDAAYRLVFTGGWIHTNNGAQPNGTTGYADSKYNPYINGQLNSTHISYYSRTNSSSSNAIDMGALSAAPGNYHHMHIRYTGDLMFGLLNTSSAVSVSNNISQGLFISSRINNTNVSLYRNNSNIGNVSLNSSTQPSNNIYIGAGNITNSPQQYSSKESSFISIGDGLTDTEASNFYITVQKFQTTLGRHVGTPYVSDPDAIAFLIAAGITDGTQAAAINTLVIRMKADGVWTKMKAIYPFVGGSAVSHKFNLKDSRDLDASYRLQFNGGWTHNSNGVTPNGTNGYARTFFVDTNLSANSVSYSIYNRSITPTTKDLIDFGYFKLNSGYISNLFSTYYGGTVGGRVNSWTSQGLTQTSPQGFYNGNRTNSLDFNFFKNGSKFITGSDSTVGKLQTGYQFHLGCLFIDGQYYDNFTSNNYAFAHIGDGLTDTEATNLYSAVQAYQTTLGRQVNVPLVSDTDAQSFLNAANITSFQQASAVNKLVIDLKAAGVWSKMKAIYPFVGGSAASHKFNLKDPRDLDAAYRLVFNGGWTHTGTGALPNGTTGYANTKLVPSNVLTNNNTHLSYYSRTDKQGSQVEIGYVAANPYRLSMELSYNGMFSSDQYNYNTGRVSTTNSVTTGYYISSRTTSSIHKSYKSGIQLGTTNTGTSGDISLVSGPIYIGTANKLGGVLEWFSSKETTFASIGDGLTDLEASTLYNAVQTYQTSLGRSVNTPVYNNGLVLNLDAGNANSYPGTGTTWFDLAAGNNGTLVNGPTYDATNGGSLLFDGINDYVDLGSNFKFVDKDLTLDFWIKCTDNSNVYHDIILMAKADQSTGVGLLKSRSGTNNGGSIYFYFGNTYLVSSMTGTQLVAAGIVNYTAVAKKESGLYKIYLYRNGVLDGSLNTTISTYDMNTFTNFFARIGSGGPSFPEIWQGNIYSGKVWSRALSATEILNNFNSTRGRFGL